MEAANQHQSIKARLAWFVAISKQFSQLDRFIALPKTCELHETHNPFLLWGRPRGQALHVKEMR